MKKIIGILAALMMCFTLSSCITTAEAQVDGVYYYDDNVDINVVITYGTPYYSSEGLLLYYIYRNMYYYPYYHHNRYYLRRFYRPLPPHRHFYNNGPHRRHHMTPSNRGTQHVRPNTHTTQPRPNGNVRPNINRGGGSMSRPITPRSSTRTTVGGGNRGSFGGRR